MGDLPTNWLTGCGPWRQFAACQSADPELFFPVPAPGADLRQVEAAKAICAGCPVRGQCLALATVTRREHGVWGGLTEEERRTPGSGQSPAAQGRRRTSRRRAAARRDSI